MAFTAPPSPNRLMETPTHRQLAPPWRESKIGGPRVETATAVPATYTTMRRRRNLGASASTPDQPSPVPSASNEALGSRRGICTAWCRSIGHPPR